MPNLPKGSLVPEIIKTDKYSGIFFMFWIVETLFIKPNTSS